MTAPPGHNSAGASREPEPGAMRTFRGIAVSPGVGIGRAFVIDDLRQRIPIRSIAPHVVEAEQARLNLAIEASLEELDALRSQAERELGGEAAAIFAFHQGMLKDPVLTEPMHARIAAQQVGAEYAVQEEFAKLADRFAGMGNTAFSTKVDDVWDLDHRVLRHLIGERTTRLDDIADDAVVIAVDLTPTQTASFPRKHVRGFVTAFGGPTSHTAIFARALSIPAAVGAGGGSRGIVDAAKDGDTVIVDGDRGVVILNPEPDLLERYRAIRTRAQTLQVSLADAASLDAETKDGVPITLMGNVEFGTETKSVVRYGGRGIGLFRSEFLWLTATEEPTEAVQFEHYAEAVRAAAPYPVTIRTFDLGADKQTQGQQQIPERNPFLGLRSIRYCLRHPKMFRRQLRAILRASAIGPVRIMFPLVTSATELRDARIHLENAMEELRERDEPFDADVKVGMMVEVPSAAVMANTFAKLVDFFSIGTNDLVQYTLAVDRTNERVADLYTAAHPAVVRLVKDVIRAGRRQNIDVSLCGEAAGDPRYTMLLIGLGLRTLSVTPSRIPFLKRVIRGVEIAECERLARTVGSFDSQGQIDTYLLDQTRKRFPELVDGRFVDTGDREPQ